MNSKYTQLIEKAYAGFNAREIDTVLSLMAPDVHWPKAFDGGYAVGHEAVRQYWTKQWSEIDPKVDPAAIIERPDGKVQVEVKQLVKDLNGAIIFDGMVRHVYVIKNDLIVSMDIESV